MSVNDSDSLVVMTYGPSGIGKSTDLGYSFPNALFLAAPGALHSVENTCGYKPKSIMVPTIEKVVELMPSISKDFDTIVIDDFSFLAEQTFAILDSRFTGFKVWNELRDVALSFREKARYAGIRVIMSCWEQPPKTKPNGAKIRGGPLLAASLPEQVPAMCDVVLRAVHEPNRKPWPAVYKCNNDPNWVLKDRLDVVPHISPAPMNIGEVLRAAGIHITRHPELKGQEEMVETIAQSLSGDPAVDSNAANDMFKALLSAGKPYAEARWTLRDALDRALIRKGLREARSRFV